jgi:thioesterase domain-containing protein
MSGFAIPPEALCALERRLHEEIPLSRAMAIRVVRCDARGLELAAPLAPNLNHKRTAFGGSLANVATLSGWGLLQLLLREHEPVTLVIQDCHVEYLRAVTADFTALCPPPDPERMSLFLARLARKGLARIELEARIPAEGTEAVRFHGRFAAFGPRQHLTGAFS